MPNITSNNPLPQTASEPPVKRSPKHPPFRATVSHLPPSPPAHIRRTSGGSSKRSSSAARGERWRRSRRRCRRRTRRSPPSPRSARRSTSSMTSRAGWRDRRSLTGPSGPTSPRACGCRRSKPDARMGPDAPDFETHPGPFDPRDTRTLEALRPRVCEWARPEAWTLCPLGRHVCRWSLSESSARARRAPPWPGGWAPRSEGASYERPSPCRRSASKHSLRIRSRPRACALS